MVLLCLAWHAGLKENPIFLWRRYSCSAQSKEDSLEKKMGGNCPDLEIFLCSDFFRKRLNLSHASLKGTPLEQDILNEILLIFADTEKLQQQCLDFPSFF